MRGICIAISDSRRHGEYLGPPTEGSPWGRELAVPEHSQMANPDGGEAWCSLVSLSMVMAYWVGETGRRDLDQMVPAVVRGTYDHAYGGTATGRSIRRTLPLADLTLRLDGSARSRRRSGR